jgi:hypothetical protein
MKSIVLLLRYKVEQAWFVVSTAQDAYQAFTLAEQQLPEDSSPASRGTNREHHSDASRSSALVSFNSRSHGKAVKYLAQLPS